MQARESCTGQNSRTGQWESDRATQDDTGDSSKGTASEQRGQKLPLPSALFPFTSREPFPSRRLKRRAPTRFPTLRSFTASPGTTGAAAAGAQACRAEVTGAAGRILQTDHPRGPGARDPPAASAMPKAAASPSRAPAHRTRGPRPRAPHLLLHVGVAEGHGEREAGRPDNHLGQDASRRAREQPAQTVPAFACSLRLPTPAR